MSSVWGFTEKKVNFSRANIYFTLYLLHFSDINVNVVAHNCACSVCVPQTIKLLRNVEKLWHVDNLPNRNEKTVTHSGQDKEAIDLLEKKTTYVGVDRSQESVIPKLWNTEKQLRKDQNVLQPIVRYPEADPGWCCGKVKSQILTQEGELWFIPHHMVSHNNIIRTRLCLTFLPCT